MLNSSVSILFPQFRKEPDKSMLPLQCGDSTDRKGGEEGGEPSDGSGSDMIISRGAVIMEPGRALDGFYPALFKFGRIISRREIRGRLIGFCHQLLSWFQFVLMSYVSYNANRLGFGFRLITIKICAFGAPAPPPHLQPICLSNFAFARPVRGANFYAWRGGCRADDRRLYLQI